MQCKDCAHADFESKPGWARHGFSRCVKSEPWRYMSESWVRQCGKFKALGKEAAEGRMTMLNELRGIYDEEAEPHSTETGTSTDQAPAGGDNGDTAPGWWQSL